MKLFLRYIVLIFCIFSINTSVLKSDITFKGTSRGYIPRVLHHIYWPWSKDKSIDRRRFEVWSTCRNSCITRCQGFQYILWNETMIEDVIRQDYPDLFDLYRSYTYDIQRCDVARYVIMHKYGGIYLDMDDCCRVNLEYLLSNIERANATVALPNVLPFGTGNDIIVSTPRNSFFSYAIVCLRQANKWYVTHYFTILFSTGTAYLSNRRLEYERSRSDVIFYLINLKERYERYLYRESGSTWHEIDGDIIVHVYNYLYSYAFLSLFVMAFLVLRKNKRFCSIKNCLIKRACTWFRYE